MGERPLLYGLTRNWRDYVLASGACQGRLLPEIIMLLALGRPFRIQSYAIEGRLVDLYSHQFGYGDIL